jgi:NADH:ubiquinone oxidoreductase subunit D
MIYDLFEELCGARFTVSYTRVGGLAQDMPARLARPRAALRPARWCRRR